MKIRCFINLLFLFLLILISLDKSYNDRDCYKTNPTQTHIGWVLNEKVKENTKEKIFYWGCFYAEKKESTPVSSFVLHNGMENKTNLVERHN
ncbi:hypothetical protein PFFCH_02776 [Plasmodium falciparum FCH/4]|uniref:Uncharacterized protein n=1 Tax=Plasmodium falciparum FCH/4 TaxID=1036724 RepID=A0A024VM39_PLAFA|nr:hypothetical protein PFFCH_02776 [Plasmodium falciparum FCH/4]